MTAIPFYMGYLLSLNRVFVAEIIEATQMVRKESFSCSPC
jgi:hypothetical protein